MKTSRIKLPLTSNLITTRDDAEAAMRDLAIAVNSQRKVLADRDAAILAINKRIEAPMAELDATIKSKTDALRAWAESNPDAFPKGRKSIDLVSGTLGFRTGTPALKLFSRAFTWDKVLGLVRRCYIRTKDEVAKDLILSDFASGFVKTDDLRAMGLKVTQDESFFVEPDLTKIATRQVEAA